MPQLQLYAVHDDPASKFTCTIHHRPENSREQSVSDRPGTGHRTARNHRHPSPSPASTPTAALSPPAAVPCSALFEPAGFGWSHGGLDHGWVRISERISWILDRKKMAGRRGYVASSESHAKIEGEGGAGGSRVGRKRLSRANGYAGEAIPGQYGGSTLRIVPSQKTLRGGWAGIWVSFRARIPNATKR
jgi:hypothetical protein